MVSVDFDRDDLFDFEDNFFSLTALAKYDRKLIEQTKEALGNERRFCRQYLAPMVLSEDRKHLEDRDYCSWDLLRLAGRHERLTALIPKAVGGSGTGSMAITGPSMEEMASVDTAFAGLLGGHGLGLVSLMMTFNMKVMDRILNNIVTYQKSEKPYVIDCAITEPTAGTDVEEVELYPKARLMCQARRVSGGAVLNGRKVFISTGHLASDHVVIMPFDMKDAVNSMGSFIVPSGAKGFSLGRKEYKMGQLAGPASELIFDDCFVPEENIVMTQDEFPGEKYKGRFQTLLHAVLGITRIAVGAMSTGTARGVLERTLAVAREEKHRGRTLIHQQWAQTILTNMFMNVMMARSVYMEASFALLTNMGGNLTRPMPGFMETEMAKKVFESKFFKKILHSKAMRKYMLNQMAKMESDENARIQYMSSLAKVVGSDMAMENCQLAVEFMGKAGLRHDRGIEKMFRDAKLLQIFEGTNQLNRLNIFTHYFGRYMPEVKVF